MSEMVRVLIRCAQVVTYHRKCEIPRAAVAQYEAAVDRDEPDSWFSDFAARYIDPLNDADADDTYDDVELTVLKEQVSP